MQRIYEPRDLIEAELLLGMLASEGIEAFISGQHLAGAVGELPASGLLGLMVNDLQAGQARELITAYNGAQPLPGDEPESYLGELVC
ncbi:putative signal transducing protein [Pseudomonas sp. RL_15y_Pfl2_60]|uniref:putative signal transducing protein n=1 Tax=Pseudomonas sp. RL_15y_Pfl2_60 TaxID=3088709 RepID=UPI0030D93C7D